MYSLTDSTLRLLRRILGGPGRTAPQGEGISGVFDGNTAVALVEASIAQAAAVDISGPGNGAALAWRLEQQRRQSDPSDGLLSVASTEGPRGALAYAAGLTMSGVRATAFLSGPELAGLQDLLATTAGRHLPLVLHVTNQSIGGPSSALGSGHEVAHLSADSGCFLLIAASVQEAVDFTLIARQVAEQTLVPGLVFMDLEQTALAFQQAHLPSRELVSEFLGRPEDAIRAHQGQRLLFGEQRRRVPRWHDLDRPVLLGGVQNTTTWGLGRVASGLYLEREFDRILDSSCERFAIHSGRVHSRVTDHRVEDADVVLVAMGSMIETAKAAADRARAMHRTKVGVLGIRSLRPFPGEQLLRLLKPGCTLCLLERQDAPLAADPPLLREITAAVNRAGMRGVAQPRLVSALYGFGGLPLEGGELVELCRTAASTDRSKVYLGVRFDQPVSPYPKRQVLLDRLRRNFPEVADKGLPGQFGDADLRPEEAVTLSIQRLSGEHGGGLAQEVAGFLWRMGNGGIRSRPALPSAPWGEGCLDQLTWAGDELGDPGDIVPADLAFLSAPAAAAGIGPRLAQDAVLLIEAETLEHGGLPAAALSELQRKQGILYVLGTLSTRDQVADPGLWNDQALGAIFRVLIDQEWLEAGLRTLLSSREGILSELSPEMRERRLKAFRAGFEATARVDAASLANVPGHPDKAEREIPPFVHGLGNFDDDYDNLSRFWNQLGILYQDPDGEAITPDPYLAAGVMPPLSSAFRTFDGLRKGLPTLDAEACTGCGACWSLCPEGAVGVRALGPAALLETCIAATGMERLRPLSGRLSRRMGDRCRAQGAKPTTVGELLEDAFDWLSGQSLPAGRRALLSSAREPFLEVLRPIQMSVTETLFQAPDKQAAGNGDLLMLNIDPGTCKGCGICIEQCEPGALTLAPETPQLISAMNRHRNGWERLPEVSAQTIDRAASQKEIGPLAALMMSRSPRLTLAGGDGAAPGSGERLALRVALAAADAIQRPRYADLAARVEEARKRISGLIRKIMADALPADDLDALASGLDHMESSESDLARFINETETGIDNRIDTLRLRRLVDLARQLKAFSQRLGDGGLGSGRGTLGMVLSSDTPSGWAGGFPYNPFAIPVAVDASGDGAALALGLQYGQVHQTIEGIVLLRKAALELESPADAVRLWSRIEALAWQDLDPEERALCPPVLVAGSGALIAGRGLAQLSEVLGGALPVKLLVFTDLDLGLGGRPDADLPPARISDPATELGLLALARRDTFIAQCALGYPDHLVQTLNRAFAHPGPALLQIHTPCPARHGFPSNQTVQRARLAVDTRTLPLMAYDPGSEGVFGTRFDLAANPGMASQWLAQESTGVLTPADWALGEQRFSHCFTPIGPDTPDPTPLGEYLALQPEAREGRTPFLTQSIDGGRKIRLQVSSSLVRACDGRLQAWRTLQEVAGLVTPFTARVEQQAQQDVAVAHQAELQALRDSYEARIRHLREETLEQTRDEIRSRLLAMAGYQDTGGEPPAAGSGQAADSSGRLQ